MYGHNINYKFWTNRHTDKQTDIATTRLNRHCDRCSENKKLWVDKRLAGCLGADYLMTELLEFFCCSLEITFFSWTLNLGEENNKQFFLIIFLDIILFLIDSKVVGWEKGFLQDKTDGTFECMTRLNSFNLKYLVLIFLKCWNDILNIDKT